MKTNLPLKKSKPSYSFSRLANSFSNPDLVENVHPSKASTQAENRSCHTVNTNSMAKSQGSGPYSFNTPYVKTSSVIVKDICAQVSTNNNVKRRKSSTNGSRKIPPRGKCFDWEHCEQCSLTLDCGVCSNCLKKSLK